MAEPPLDADAAAPPVARAPATAPVRVAPRAGRVALALYVLCVVVYASFAGERLRAHSPDNHFAYLADAYLHRSLAVRCEADVARHVACPPGGGGNDWALYHGRWYVAFPSLPAVVYMPAVAIFGRDFPNAIYDVLLAGIAPALLYLLLERTAREGRSLRSWRENVGFTTLFAFGTVYFFSVVQGSVWFTAHMIAAALIVGYLWFALDARRPLFAGVMLGLAMHSRADLLWASPLFAIEVLRVHRRADAPSLAPDAPVTRRAVAWLRGVEWPRALRALVAFGVPFGAFFVLSLALNKVRFGDWGEVGYRYLQIRWRDRIEHWGLFNYHYLGRNLGIALASLPWLTRTPPYVVVSLHGLALWVTTPHYLELVRLRRRAGDRYTPFLAASAGAIALSVLLYQNSGWIQFGFRFSNDFAIFLILLLAINGRRIGRLWIAALIFAIAVNAFGAWSFGRQIPFGNRRLDFYDNDFSQQRYFQPD